MPNFMHDPLRHVPKKSIINLLVQKLLIKLTPGVESENFCLASHAKLGEKVSFVQNI